MGKIAADVKVGLLLQDTRSGCVGPRGVARSQRWLRPSAFAKKIKMGAWSEGS